MKIKFVSALLLTLLMTSSFGSKINRITLSELHLKADLIVMGKVTDLVHEGNNDRVTIQIDSHLKGKCLQKVVSFTLVTRGGLKDFDPSLNIGDSGVFFLKLQCRSGAIEKAYWGSIATFPKNHFELTNPNQELEPTRKTPVDEVEA